jgi:hypothetical protein
MRSRSRRPEAQPVEIEKNDRRRVKRQHLAHDQAADNGDAEKAPEFRTSTSLTFAVVGTSLKSLI